MGSERPGFAYAMVRLPRRISPKREPADLLALRPTWSRGALLKLPRRSSPLPLLDAGGGGGA